MKLKPAQTETPASEVRPGKILVAVRDLFTRNTISYFLRRKGYEVKCVSSAAEAEAFASLSSKTSWEAVILTRDEDGDRSLAGFTALKGRIRRGIVLEKPVVPQTLLLSLGA